MKQEIEKFEILKAFALMLGESNISKIKKHEKIILTSCKDNSEVWWNYALVNNALSEEELNYIEDFFKKINRLPSVYFSDDEENKPIADFLTKKEYKISAKDSWLFWNKGEPNVNSNGIIEVKTDEDFEKWIETFIKSYPKDDPKNPYGEQTEFAEVLKRSWKEKKNKNDRYFLFYIDDLPEDTAVATAILTTYNNMGYISGVGSIPSVRGKGFGKKVSLHCIKESIKEGNTYHFLATEQGDYPYEFYNRIGFEPEFTAFLYTKKK